jgi:hypothetical protein
VAQQYIEVSRIFYRIKVLISIFLVVPEMDLGTKDFIVGLDWGMNLSYLYYYIRVGRRSYNAFGEGDWEYPER